MLISLLSFQKRFVIKWKGFSHLHNTEELFDFLRKKNYRGMKRVINYIKGTYAIQTNILTNRHTSREDLEAFAIEKERITDVRVLTFFS